jgi:hypothetical protein
MKSMGIGMAAVAALAVPAGTAGAQASCDRACLVGRASGLVDALVARDPARLGKGEIRYTENGQHLKLGDGLWGTASGRRGYDVYFADPQSGEASVISLIEENGLPAILSARIKVEGDEVREVEALVARTSLRNLPADEGYKSVAKPHVTWSRPVPVGERMSREELIRTADKYFEAIENNDGKRDYSFLSPSCERLENGIRTTHNAERFQGPPPPAGSPPQVNVSGLGCAEQFKTGFFRIVTEVRGRRFPIVDVERGIVYAMGFFDHSGQVREYQLTDGRTVHSQLAPWTWQIGEAFKIERGQISFIEALLVGVPYRMPSAWQQ